jgi:hypothetical protein
MKARPAGSMMEIGEAMSRCVELADGAALMAYLREHYDFLEPTIQNVTIKPYGRDERIGWDTYLVCIDGKAALFTDGPMILSE